MASGLHPVLPSLRGRWEPTRLPLQAAALLEDVLALIQERMAEQLRRSGTTLTVFLLMHLIFATASSEL
eukprot:10368641-Prorocentrum_lima.AAC.1